MNLDELSLFFISIFYELLKNYYLEKLQGGRNGLELKSSSGGMILRVFLIWKLVTLLL
jgi:hypothetical protein